MINTAKCMKITIISVGKIKEKFYREAVAEYAKRLSSYCKFQIIELTDEKTPENASLELENQIKDREGERILKAVDEKGRIVGSVRGYPENDTVYIGKLIVAPEMQGRGIGTKLLMEIENVYPDKRYEIFTSSESDKNIRLYEKLGYKPLKSEHISEQIKMVFLEKCDNLSF